MKTKEREPFFGAKINTPGNSSKTSATESSPSIAQQWKRKIK